jgi:NADH dehydrogenase
VNILVTGGTGFVGPRVVHALRSRDLPVRALARKPELESKLRSWNVELVQGDMTDPESLKRAVNGVDTVVHLVAIRQGTTEQFRRIMIEGTQGLLDAAKAAGVKRFVLMSALGTTEETKDVVPYYGAKWAEEQDVKASGIPYVIFRPSFIFAEGGGILKTFAKLAKIGPVTAVTGKGTQLIQPIWIDDLAQFFAEAATRDDVLNQTWELGGPDRVDWNEFWTRLRRTLGIKRRPTVHMPMWFMRANAVVTERLPGNIPLTRDLLKMLEAGDNVTADNSAAETFGVKLMPLDEQLRRGTA